METSSVVIVLFLFLFDFLPKRFSCFAESTLGHSGTNKTNAFFSSKRYVLCTVVYGTKGASRDRSRAKMRAKIVEFRFKICTRLSC